MKVRVAVFVDVQNVQETFERQGYEVRYDALKDFILTQFGLDEREVKFLAFVPHRRDDERRIRLVDALSFMGFRVITKPVREHPAGGIKANMDTEMVLEAMELSSFVEEFILVTGDSDFVPLVDYLSRHGKRVSVLGPGRGSTSVELIRASDHFQNIDEVPRMLVPRHQPESAGALGR